MNDTRKVPWYVYACHPGQPESYKGTVLAETFEEAFETARHQYNTDDINYVHALSDTMLTTDRDGIAIGVEPTTEIVQIGKFERKVPIGTNVEHRGHVVGDMVLIRFDDGTEAVMNPHCFARLRKETT